MAKTFDQDKTGELERCANFLIGKYPDDFGLFSELRFLFLWRLGAPKYDDERRPVAAWTKLCSSRERDIYSKDVEICVHRNSWQDRTKVQKTQLIFHELLHIRVMTNEDFEIMKDEDGRIKIDINPHDIVIKGFTREIDLFGMHTEHVRVVGELTKKVKRHHV